jgi:NTE family protein
VDALVHPGPAKEVPRKSVQEKVDALLATDDFQQVRYRFVDADGERALVLEPIAKGWGPNYLRMGLNLSTNFAGDSNFTIALDHRMTWLNQLGLEWRNDITLGQLTGISSELYQPLDYARRYFIAPRVLWWQQNVNLYVNDDAIAQFRDRQAGAGIDFGVNLSRAGELRLGYVWEKVWAWRSIGSPSFPDYEEDYGALRARLVLDKLDNWAFPSSGYFLGAMALAARPGLGGSLDFNRADLRIEKPFALDARHRLTTALEWGDSLGTTLPITEAFQLGGFLRLSGYQPLQFLSEGYTFGRLVYYYRLGAPGAFADRLFVGGSLEAAYVKDRLNGTPADSFVPAGSVFVAADTPAGPLYLGFGLAQDNNYGVYLFLGRP